MFRNVNRVVAVFVVVLGFVGDQGLQQETILKPTTDKQGSDKMRQDQLSSDKIKPEQTKLTKGTARINRQAPLAETITKRQDPKRGGGGMTPHGVFNPLRARRRLRRV